MEALKMEREMTHWNDDRLDELNGRMKEGFAKVDKRADERFAEVDQRFEQVDKRFEQVDKRFDKVDEHFVRLEGEMKEGFAASDRNMKQGFAEVKAEIRQMGDHLEKRIDRVSNRLDRFMFTVFAAGAGLLVAALNGGLS
ncbi:MAG TPA: hypothetical protein VFJ53_00350 [Solirubrobacterales bacterium]|nr:hypothetical protein [Solirubrobacterales bacterium]